MPRKPNFIVAPESFRLLRDKVDIGKIVELGAADSSLIAPHIQGHPETIYAACSGVDLTGQYGVFQAGERQLAVEWVRQEGNLQPTELECNTYRYIFGLTPNGNCFGYDVTKPLSSPSTGQVADHWITFDEVVRRHFPEI